MKVLINKPLMLDYKDHDDFVLSFFASYERIFDL